MGDGCSDCDCFSGIVFLSVSLDLPLPPSLPPFTSLTTPLRCPSLLSRSNALQVHIHQESPWQKQVHKHHENHTCMLHARIDALRRARACFLVKLRSAASDSSTVLLCSALPLYHTAALLPPYRVMTQHPTMRPSETRIAHHYLLNPSSRTLSSSFLYSIDKHKEPPSRNAARCNHMPSANIHAQAFMHSTCITSGDSKQDMHNDVQEPVQWSPIARATGAKGTALEASASSTERSFSSQLSAASR